MVTKARQLAEFIANADVDSDEIATGAVSASKLADTLDLSSKTIVMPDVAAFNITSGDVGIGTDSPSAPVHVQRTTDASIRVKNTVNNANTIQHLELYNNDETGFLKLGVGRSGSGGSSTLTSASEMRFLVNSSERMRIDTSGNVGMGVTTPSESLDIGGGSIRIGNSKIRHSGSGGSWDMAFETYSGGYFERMRIDSVGNVGIGLTDPGNALTIARDPGDSRVTLLSLKVTDNDYGNGTGYNHASSIVFDMPSYEAGTRSYRTAAMITGGKDGIADWWTGSASTNFQGALRFHTRQDDVLTEQMRIDADGNVGIGTTSVGYVDANRNTLQVNGTTSSIVALAYGGTNAGYMYADSNITQLWSEGTRQFDFGIASAGFMTFKTNNTERMRIDASGHVGIGAAATTYPLEVSDTNGNGIAYRDTTNSVTTFLGAYNSVGITGTLTNHPYTLWTNNAERVRIDASGNVLPGADAAYDLGSTSLRWNNIYTTDLQLSNMGKEGGNDVDGTTGNWTIQEGEDSLYIINNRNGKKFKFALEEIE